jgi:hypothetical protein
LADIQRSTTGTQTREQAANQNIKINPMQSSEDRWHLSVWMQVAIVLAGVATRSLSELKDSKLDRQALDFTKVFIEMPGYVDIP